MGRLSTTECTYLPTSRFRTGTELGPSLGNALEITMKESPLALQMFLHGHENCPESWVNNGLFLPQNCSSCATLACHSLSCLLLCTPLKAQSPWKNNGPHWKHGRGIPTIVLTF